MWPTGNYSEHSASDYGCCPMARSQTRLISIVVAGMPRVYIFPFRRWRAVTIKERRHTLKAAEEISEDRLVEMQKTGNLENGKAIKGVQEKKERDNLWGTNSRQTLASRRKVKLMDSVPSRNGQLIPSILSQRQKKALCLYFVQERIRPILNPGSYI